MSIFRDEKNRLALARLNRALPESFPQPVLTHALARRWIPPMPRLAVDSYWRAHPIRADRLARALAAKSGAPLGWAWQIGERGGGLPTNFRMPPAPYRESRFSLGPGHCCVCGQPVYRLGWHVDLWDRGPNKQAMWHTACVVAWQLWSAPSHFARPLRRLQRHRCAETGKRLLRTSEVDHRVPLFEVWRAHHETKWPKLLDFWGLPNLRIINRGAHVAKCAEEAGARAQGRARLRVPPSGSAGAGDAAEHGA